MVSRVAEMSVMVRKKIRRLRNLGAEGRGEAAQKDQREDKNRTGNSSAKAIGTLSNVFKFCTNVTSIGYQTHQFALLWTALKSLANFNRARPFDAPGGPRRRRTSSNPRVIVSTRLLLSSEVERSIWASAATPLAA